MNKYSTFIKRGICILCTMLCLMFCTGIQIYASQQDNMFVTPKVTQTPEVMLTPTPVLTQIPTPSPTTPSVKKGLKKEGKYYRYYKNGKVIKNTWKTISGHRYYFQANGNAAVGSVLIKGTYYIFNEKGWLLTPKKNSIVKVGNGYYYITPKGNPVTGWNIVNDKLYYAYKNGKCAVNRTIDDIHFTKNGTARNDVQTKLRIKCLKVIDKVTTPSMSKDTKLRKCWYYLNTIRFQPWKFPDTTKKNWPQQCALDLLNTMGETAMDLRMHLQLLQRHWITSPM